MSTTLSVCWGHPTALRDHVATTPVLTRGYPVGRSLEKWVDRCADIRKRWDLWCGQIRRDQIKQSSSNQDVWTVTPVNTPVRRRTRMATWTPAPMTRRAHGDFRGYDSDVHEMIKLMPETHNLPAGIRGTLFVGEDDVLNSPDRSPEYLRYEIELLLMQSDLSADQRQEAMSYLPDLTRVGAYLREHHELTTLRRLKQLVNY